MRAGGCEEITRAAKAVMLTAVPKALRAQVLFPGARGMRCRPAMSEARAIRREMRGATPGDEVASGVRRESPLSAVLCRDRTGNGERRRSPYVLDGLVAGGSMRRHGTFGANRDRNVPRSCYRGRSTKNRRKRGACGGFEITETGADLTWPGCRTPELRCSGSSRSRCCRCWKGARSGPWCPYRR